MSFLNALKFESFPQDIFAKLQTDLGPEIELFREFSIQYGNRLNKLKEAINAYESRSQDIRKYIDFVSGIESNNDGILQLLNRIIGMEKREDLIIKAASFVHEAGDSIIGGLSEENYQRALAITRRKGIGTVLANLNRDTDVLYDNLLSLKGIIGKQTKYAKGAARRKKYIAFERDYGVYLLLKDESAISDKITRSLVTVMTETKRFVASPSRYFQKREFGKLHVEEVLPYYQNRDFLLLYETVYCKLFPDPDEREPLENFIHFGQERLKDYKEKSMGHVLMLKAGPVPVGGFVFDFVGVDSDLCFAVAWFLFIEKEFRIKGLNPLIERAKVIAYADARHFGYNRIMGVFGEVEDPKIIKASLLENSRKRRAALREFFKELADREFERVMKQFEAKRNEMKLKFETLKERLEMVKTAVTNAQADVGRLQSEVESESEARARLWKSFRFKKVDLKYVQAPLGGSPVYNLNLMFLPLEPELKDGIPSAQMEKMYRRFITFGFRDINPDTYFICQRIIREIRSKKIVKLIDLR